MTTEKMSEKDAVYLCATNPIMFMHKPTGNGIRGDLSSSSFLKGWRDGSIILAPVPEEQPKPVSMPVIGYEKGLPHFFLPKNHKQSFRDEILISHAAAYGGVDVYHLPDGHIMKIGIAPVWWSEKTKCYYLDNSCHDDPNRFSIWPSEIEFSPAFLKGE